MAKKTIWLTDKTTYHYKGRVFSKGDIVPDAVLLYMGEETAEEYKKNGWLGHEKEMAKVDNNDAERLALLEELKELGLKPNYRTGIEKLEKMKADYLALKALKEEALELGIDPSDDVTFSELTKLVDEKKAE